MYVANKKKFVCYKCDDGIYLVPLVDLLVKQTTFRITDVSPQVQVAPNVNSLVLFTPIWFRT